MAAFTLTIIMEYFYSNGLGMCFGRRTGRLWHTKTAD
jgi:hypothetical protein